MEVLIIQYFLASLLILISISFGMLPLRVGIILIMDLFRKHKIFNKFF